MREVTKASASKKDALNKVVQKITSIMQIGSCSIMAKKGRFLFIKAARGLPASVVRSVKLKEGEGIAGWVALSGRPLLVKNVGTHYRFRLIKRSGRVYKTNSLLSIPIKRRGKVVGVLNLTDKKSGEQFTVADLDLLSAVAAQISPILG